MKTFNSTSSPFISEARKLKFYSLIVEAVCLLFILLFVYTGVSKFLDYENFRAIIGQSPLVTKFAGPLSIGVPTLEIIISLLLLFQRFRLKALIASFCMMVLFTAYIIVLVTLSEKIPCSCGGVIQRMSWDQHLYFNILFMLLALYGVFLQSKLQNELKK